MAEREDTFRVAVRQFGPFEEAIQKQWSHFANETGVSLKLEAVPLDLHELYQALVTDDGLRDGRWDVAFLSSDWFADIHDRRAVVDLTPYLESSPPQDYPGGWPDSLVAHQLFGATCLGLPYHDGPECLIYRTDLFGDQAEKQAYQSRYGEPLAPPRTWEEFTRIAEFFHRPENGLYGTTFAAFPDGHNTVFDFCLQLWSRGGELFDADGELQLVSNQAVSALEYYRAIMTNPRAIHPRSAEFDSVRAGQAIADGEVAMAINWFGFAAVAAAHPSSRVRGMIDIAAIPSDFDTGISLNSYWILAIAAGSFHRQTAYDFLRFCASPEMDALLTQTGGIGCRRSTWADPDINASIPFYHRLESLHAVARTLPRRSNWTHISSVIDSIVLATINSREGIESILNRHASEWATPASK